MSKITETVISNSKNSVNLFLRALLVTKHAAGIIDRQEKGWQDWDAEVGILDEQMRLHNLAGIETQVETLEGMCG